MPTNRLLAITQLTVKHIFRPCKQAGRAARVPEENVFLWRVYTGLDAIDKFAKAAPGIDRIKENALCPRQQTDCFSLMLTGCPISSRSNPYRSGLSQCFYSSPKM